MGLLLHQLTVQGVVSPHHRPPVAYNCCVSVFQEYNSSFEPTTLQLIDETCISRFSSTSATGWLIRDTFDIKSKRLICYSLIHPYLTYCLNIWSSTYRTNLKISCTAQKKSVCALFFFFFSKSKKFHLLIN